MSPADAPATHHDRQRLVLRLAELGIPTTDTDRQRHVCAVWTKGRARKRSELTKHDAGALYARLQTMTREELAAVLAMPAPGAPAEPAPPAAPEPVAIDAAACLASWDELPGEPELDGALRAELAELPAGVLVCGGQPTAADVAAVAAFAAELAERGPAPSAEELAAVEAATVEPGPAPADTADGQRPGTPDGDAPATVADHRPAAPVPVEPPCRTPEEIEAAAVAAVERFRARQAAGIVPEPPDPAERPPRAVVRYTAPGRYCLDRCYCGACPQYAEQRAAADLAYSRELRRALNPDQGRDTPRRRR